MHPLSIKLIVIVVAILSIVWLALKVWRDNRGLDSEVNLKADLHVSKDQGWTFFNLLLVNGCRMNVAVVDATFTISGLVAQFQASPAATETTFKIRRIVKPGAALGVDLVEHFYNAAGRPQRSYTFVVATTVRYRARGKVVEQALPLYRVKMFALSANRLWRVRWYNKPAAMPEPVRRVPALDPADQQWLDAEASRAPSV